MVEVVRASKTEPLSFVDRETLSKALPYGLPILMAFICVFSLSLTVQRAGALRTWTDTYSGAGTFLVEGCSPVDEFGGNQWTCDGRFTSSGAVDGDRTLTTSRDAFASDRPYVGQRLEVFHEQGNSAVVYPLQFRLNEIARAYLSLLPRFLVFVGAALWLAGWFLTRNVDRDDFVTRDGLRFPQRFGWRSRGISWIGAGFGALVLNYFLATKLVGSLGII